MRLVMGWLLGALISLPCPALAEMHAPSWELVHAGVGETRFVALGVGPTASDQVLAATARILYESQDGGQSWRERFRAPGQTRIRQVALAPVQQPAGVHGPAVLVATNQGLYGSFDGGAHWSRVFRGTDEHEADCTHVAFHPSQPDTALLGTRGGLFISHDRGQHWKEIGIPQVARDVVHFTFDPQQPDRLYLVSSEGVFVGSTTKGSWRQSLGQFHAEDPEVEESATVEDPQTVEENGSLHHLSAIAVDPWQPSTLYLATSRGLEVSEDDGRTWQRLTRFGLTSQAISRLLLQRHSPLVIYAATARGVAQYALQQERWTVITQGLATTQINDLASTPTHLWAATDQGLYRYQIPVEPFDAGPPPSAYELLHNFAHEPTVDQVREAAIDYAEVHPDKIKHWRREAGLKALLPTLTFGFDRDKDTFVTSRGSTTKPETDRFLITEDPSSGFDFSVKWDLSELIWNHSQTLIDVRSKLMVQLRNNIVDEVIRTYFERRRLQLALLTNPTSEQQTMLEQELRVQELTALIDGFTGGYFSKQIQVNPAPRAEGRGPAWGGVNGNHGRE